MKTPDQLATDNAALIRLIHLAADDLDSMWQRLEAEADKMGTQSGDYRAAAYSYHARANQYRTAATRLSPKFAFETTADDVRGAVEAAEAAMGGN